MTNASAQQALFAAVDAYFETMFDADLERFDRLFAPTAMLHGLCDGALRVFTTADYRSLVALNPSPKCKNEPRLEEILVWDLASEVLTLCRVGVVLSSS